MAKSTFTINEKANKSSLVATDRFLLETASDTTMSASFPREVRLYETETSSTEPSRLCNRFSSSKKNP